MVRGRRSMPPMPSPPLISLPVSTSWPRRLYSSLRRPPLSIHFLTPPPRASSSRIPLLPPVGLLPTAPFSPGWLVCTSATLLPSGGHCLSPLCSVGALPLPPTRGRCPPVLHRTATVTVLVLVMALGTGTPIVKVAMVLSPFPLLFPPSCPVAAVFVSTVLLLLVSWQSQVPH